MKRLKNILISLWRFWVYTLMTIPLIIMLPAMFFFLLKETWYPKFFVLARLWAKIIIFGGGFYYKIEQEQVLEKGKSYMFVANHTSMLDIMLMLAVIKNPFVFVGKKELAKLPFFGFLYKRSCILVDRGSSKSRLEVFERAQTRLNQGLSICIFPEGGVPNPDIVLDDFKDGAFRLGIEHQIPIVPLTFADNKRRFSYTFLSGSPGLLRVKIHQFVATTNKTLDQRRELRDEVRNVILKQIENYNS